MWFYYAGYLTISLSTFTVILQLAYMPLLIKRVENSRDIVLQNIRGFKVLERDIAGLMKSSSIRERRAVICAPARRGPPGTPGKDGQAGADGPTGKRGIDARDILAEQEEKCVICPAGKAGPEGPPGERGLQGEKGLKGPPGIPAVDGIDGEIGPEGEIGPPGYPGHPGAPGPAGRPAQGGVGSPGPKGADGPVGRAGAQGPRGKRNYIYGPPGPPGQPGPNGLDGVNGNVGDRGSKGAPGEKGADAKFCPCPMELHIISEKRVFYCWDEREKIKQHALPKAVVVKRRAPPKGETMLQYGTSLAAKPSPLMEQQQKPAQNDDFLEMKGGMSLAPELGDDQTEEVLVFPKRPSTAFIAGPPARQEIQSPGMERSISPPAGNAPGTLPGVKVNRIRVTDEATYAPRKKTMPTTAPTTSFPRLVDTTTDEAPSKLHEEKIDVPTPFGSPLSSEQAPLSELDVVDNVDDYEETTVLTTARRRFIYVTKKPRQYL